MPGDGDGVAGRRLARLHGDVVAVDRRRGRHHRLADLVVVHPALGAAELLAEQLGQDRRGHAALAELAEEPPVLGHLPQELHQGLAR